MNPLELDRQQIMAIIMVFLMIGSAVVYILAYALG